MVEVVVGVDCICPPPSGSTPQHYHDYIDRLDHLLQLTAHRSIRLAITMNVLDVLTLANQLPPLGRGETPFLQPGDLAKVFYRLLDKLKYLEEVTGIREVLLENTELTPDDCPPTLDERIRGEYVRCCGIALVARKLKVPLGKSVLLSRFGPPLIDVRVATSVVDVELEGSRQPPDLPWYIDDQVRRISSLDRIGAVSDPIMLITSGFIRDAIDLALAKERMKSGTVFNEVWPFKLEHYSLNPAFAASLRNVLATRGADVCIRALDACVDTVLSRNLARTHHLRTNAGANSPQRTRRRDEAKAWRRDIDYEYHLYYWRDGDAIELASVVTHNDYYIPE